MTKALVHSDPRRTLLGMFWMVVAGLNFVAVNAIIKHVGDSIHPVEGGFLRYLFGLVFVVPMLRPIARSRIGVAALAMCSLRGAIHCIAVVSWFFAMTRIPIAEVTAMNYLVPVCIMAAAAMFLGETLTRARIGAIVAALVGVLLILRPGYREISPGHLAMLAAALAFTFSYLLAKKLSEELNASVIVGMLTLTVAIGLAPIAALVWVTPTLTEVFWLFLVALFATAAHYTMTLAFMHAPMSATQPVTFLHLVWAALTGWLLFGEAVDAWVILGGTVIIGAVSLVSWREAAEALKIARVNRRRSR